MEAEKQEKRDKEKRFDKEEIIKKYHINLEKLEKEQKNLAKQLSIKDEQDFSSIVKVGGISNIFFQNKIISAIVILDNNFELVEQKYFSDKTRFPYIPGFRAYRELPAMASCFHELEEKPELVFISGHGISHPRLGIASHFSLTTQVPSIGVADSLLVGEIRGEDVFYNGKAVAKLLRTKEGSKPIYVSPGNMISLKTAVELTRRFIKEPHKLPEPLHTSHKYAKEVMREIFKN